MEQLFFIIFAGIALIGAVNLLLRRNPLYAALSLLTTMAALTGLYIMLKAYFIAVIQVMIYAGAIVVLFLFVIMLFNIRVVERQTDRRGYLKWLALPFAIILIGQFVYIARLFEGNPTPVGTEVGLTEMVGRKLFTAYLLPFEVTSILILAAIIGAVVLAQKE
ncbi:MAG: NADH-quinone oxidoreductase subunit J [Acidobacteria bacterium]|nr:MAG: NADH-quinone oxidoreductase subunit J [Acidobacteriota bacterium]